MNTERDHAGLGPASNIGAGSPSAGHVPAQPIWDTPCMRAANAITGIDLAEASRRGKSGMWRPSDIDNGFLSPEPLAAATGLVLAGPKRLANVPRSVKY